MKQYAGYDEARRIASKNVTPRSRYIEALESYVVGTQYDGKPDWFVQDDKIPLFDRKPCVVYAVVNSAIASNTDLVLGDGRFPAITSAPDENDSKFDGEIGLEQAASETLDRFISSVAKQARFRGVCREVFAAAQGAGSGVAICCVRDGRLVFDTTRARWCMPTFDALGNVLALEIRYPYIDTFKAGNEWKVRALIYRRVIDSFRDVTYLPAEAKEDCIEPDWVEDPALTIDHGFGFCPVIWYPFMRGCSMAGTFDGHAIHENLLDELRALDFALSMRHRAALFAGDPQWTEIGVEEGYNPTPGGQAKGMPATLKGGPYSQSNPVTSHYVEPAPRAARKKSPGLIWQYPNPDTKVQLHTLPGDALEALDRHARDLRMKISESMAVVFMDPDDIKYASSVSGKALETLKSRQIDRCDQYRDDFGEGFILPAIQMLLRMAYEVGKTGGLNLTGLKTTMPILERFNVAGA